MDKRIVHIAILTLLPLLVAACAPASSLPESAPSTTPTASALPATPQPSPSPTPQRDTALSYASTDRPDDHDGFQIHFIYALPSDGEDRFMDVNGQIEISASAANHWFAQQSGGSRLRYDTYGGVLDISFMRLPYSAEVLNILGPSIVQGFDQTLREQGFDTTHKLYIVFYDGVFNLKGESLACGQSTQPPITWGVSAAIYLRGFSPQFNMLSCPPPTSSAEEPGFLEIVLLHEIFHLLGAVPECAPHQNASHVDDDEADFMSDHLASNELADLRLDSGRDDYFAHGDLGCPDLARSVFLDPLPEFAQEPPAWRFSSQLRLHNPFLDLYQITIE